jgi:hypothetical protein
MKIGTECPRAEKREEQFVKEGRVMYQEDPDCLPGSVKSTAI